MLFTFYVRDEDAVLQKMGVLNTDTGAITGDEDTISKLIDSSSVAEKDNPDSINRAFGGGAYILAVPTTQV